MDNCKKRYMCLECEQRFHNLVECYKHIEEHEGVVKFKDIFTKEEW